MAPYRWEPGSHLPVSPTMVQLGSMRQGASIANSKVPSLLPVPHALGATGPSQESARATAIASRTAFRPARHDSARVSPLTSGRLWCDRASNTFIPPFFDERRSRLAQIRRRKRATLCAEIALPTKQCSFYVTVSAVVIRFSATNGNTSETLDAAQYLFALLDTDRPNRTKTIRNAIGRPDYFH